MDDSTVDLFEWKSNQEKYEGAVCWLCWLPKQQAYDTRETLVDIEDFERLKHLSWRIQKIGKGRKPRVVRSGGLYLARELLGFPAGKIVITSTATPVMTADPTSASALLARTT